jgi:NAD(P)-dependent dehydrogenase (short-subunit alcohol dehydrogenase family)
MTLDRQHPIGTGFGAATVAEEIVAGLDLTGRDVVVTAGHTGLGREVTRVLTGAGATVTVGCRNPERAAAGLAGLDRVRIDRLDLMDPESVEAFAARYRASGRPVHVLVNNAGLPTPGERRQDGRGHEAQFSTNYLGHFQLTLALLPALRAAGGARVVNVTSGAQRFSGIRWDDPQFTAAYDPVLAYAQSKTAGVLFAVELDRRWADEGIRGFAVHPGVVVGTALNDASGSEAHRAMGLIDEAGQPIIDPLRGKKTLQQGAATIVLGAVSPLLDGIGGVYLKDCDVSAIDDEPRPLTADSVPSEVMSHSIDPVSAQRLWEYGETLLAA